MHKKVREFNCQTNCPGCKVKKELKQKFDAKLTTSEDMRRISKAWADNPSALCRSCTFGYNEEKYLLEKGLYTQDQLEMDQVEIAALRKEMEDMNAQIAVYRRRMHAVPA